MCGGCLEGWTYVFKDEACSPCKDAPSRALLVVLVTLVVLLMYYTYACCLKGDPFSTTGFAYSCAASVSRVDVGKMKVQL